MKSMISKAYVITALICATLFCSACFQNSFIQEVDNRVGKWVDERYTNMWADMTFVLPSDYTFIEPSGPAVPSHSDEFSVTNKELNNIIVLFYINNQEATPEDYLTIVKRQLSDSPNKDYSFPAEFETTNIGGHKYLTMKTTYSFKEQNEKSYHQDGYVRKIDNTLIVLMVLYENRGIQNVNSFLSSITKIN